VLLLLLLLLLLKGKQGQLAKQVALLLQRLY
jgi:hypothetical protein